MLKAFDKLVSELELAESYARLPHTLDPKGRPQGRAKETRDARTYREGCRPKTFRLHGGYERAQTRNVSTVWPNSRVAPRDAIWRKLGAFGSQNPRGRRPPTSPKRHALGNKKIRPRVSFYIRFKWKNRSRLMEEVYQIGSVHTGSTWTGLVELLDQIEPPTTMNQLGSTHNFTLPKVKNPLFEGTKPHG